MSRPVSAEMSEPAEPAVAPPPGNPRFPLFDSLRAIAALSVVAFHVTAISQVSGTPQPGGWSGDLLRQLAGGVTVFFLISGFLLYRPFVVARLGGRPLRARDFARRRILRIVPAYWVALTALAIYPGLTGVFTSHWWVYYGYLQVYSAGTIDKGLPPAWSLCTEVTFYALLPLYAWTLSRPRFARSSGSIVGAELAALALLSAGCLGFRYGVAPHHPQLGRALPGTFDWFALGMILAVLSAVPLRARRLGWVVAVLRDWPSVAWLLALASWVGCAWYTRSAQPDLAYGAYQGTVLHYLWGLTSFFLLLPAVVEGRPGLPRRVLATSGMAWLGLISYGLYLWHFPLIPKVGHWLRPAIGNSTPLSPGSTVLLGVTAAVLVVACAGASYYVVERPILRFKDRRGRADAPGAAAGALRPAR